MVNMKMKFSTSDCSSQRKGSSCYFLVLTLIISALFSVPAFSAIVPLTGTYGTYTCTQNTYTVAAGSVVTFTDALYVQPGAIIDLGTNATIFVGSTGGPGYLEVSGNSTSPVLITSTGGARYLRLIMENGSTGKLTYCNFRNGTNPLVLNNNSSATLNRCNFDTNCLNGVTMISSNISMSFCTVNALNAAISYRNTIVGHPSPYISFNWVSGNPDVYINEAVNMTRNIDLEFNYYPGGFVSAGFTTAQTAKLDTLPQLGSNPCGDNFTGTTPIIINGGTSAVVDFAHILQGIAGLGYTYYRVDGGSLTVSGAAAALSLGKNFYTGTIVGGTRLAFSNAAASLNIVSGAALYVYGDTRTHLSSLTSLAGITGSPAQNQWGGLNLTDTANITLVNAGISCARSGIYANISTVTFDYVVLATNNIGLSYVGPAALRVSTVNFLNNTTYINSDSVATVDASLCYFGIGTPNYAQFSGTGVIDYEPWYINASLTTTGDSEPTPPALAIPANHANVDFQPDSYWLTGFDIGMYNGRPLVHEIRIATMDTFTVTVSQQAFPPTVNGYTSVSPSPLVLLPAVRYYWQVRSIDPLGANRWSEWSATWDFVIQGPSINIQITADVTQAGAGDPVNYTVSFNNVGGAAINSKVVNVLPTYVFFNNNGSSIRIPANANNVTFSAWDANTGGTRLGWQAFVPNGANQPVTWTGDPLSNTEALQVRRIEVDMDIVTKNAQGFIYYRTNVR